MNFQESKLLNASSNYNLTRPEKRPISSRLVGVGEVIMLEHYYFDRLHVM